MILENVNPYKEAMRYIENAEEALKKAGVEDKFYKDIKYTKTACGIAYSGILTALDFLFVMKNVPKRSGRKSIEFYQKNLALLDKKLLNHLNNAYTVLHLDGYNGGLNSIKTIEAGFDSAVAIINTLKQYSKNGSNAN